jgi:hypothetical protein
MSACPKCQGTGWYKYDENHSTICSSCCPHTGGWWTLTPHYHGYIEGSDNSCCRDGCGTMKRDLPKEPPIPSHE